MSYVLGTCFPASGSLSAARQAACLATAMRLPLKLVQAYSVPYVIGEFPVPVVTPDDQRQQAAQNLDSAARELRAAFPGLAISTELNYGLLADVLEEAVEKSEPALTVLGNDESEAGEMWIGTDTANAMEAIRTPALAVLPGASEPGITHICLALTPDSLHSGSALRGLETLQRTLGFRISVVTISGAIDEVSARQSELRLQLERLGAAFTNLPAEDLLSAQIAGFASRIGADCLAVLKHERGFWSALFHKSQTEALLKTVDIPVLSLHATVE